MYYKIDLCGRLVAQQASAVSLSLGVTPVPQSNSIPRGKERSRGQFPNVRSGSVARNWTLDVPRENQAGHSRPTPAMHTLL